MILLWSSSRKDIAQAYGRTSDSVREGRDACVLGCLREGILRKLFCDEVLALGDGGIDLLREHNDLVLADRVRPVLALVEEDGLIALRCAHCDAHVNFVVDITDRNDLTAFDLEWLPAQRRRRRQNYFRG